MNLLARLAILIICLIASWEVSNSQSRGFGAGVIIGEPTGLNGKAWISGQTALVGGIAWDLGGPDDRFQIHLDHLWHFHDAIRSSEQFSPYLGIGGRLIADDGEGGFGVRVPLGLVWIPDNAPLDVFVEIVPIVDLAPNTDLEGNWGLGARFFFD